MIKPVLFIILFWPFLAHADVKPEFKEAINRYYSIPKLSKSFDWSDETSAKEQILEIFKKVFTRPKIDQLNEWVKNTSTQSSFYTHVFDEIEPVGNINWLKSTSLSGNKNKVTVERVKKSVYLESDGITDFKLFIEQNKITNHTAQELEALQTKTKTPDLIEYIVFSKVKEEFLLVNTGSGILISDIQHVGIISSTLEVSMP